MIPRELIGEADVPGGPPLRLFRRGDDFMIVLDRNELMSTRMHGSEVALGTMACDRIAARKAPHLLIGGYGMGYTLRAVLGRLGADALVTVAELVPGIIAWARGPMAAITAGCLDDRRVTLTMGDVAATMAQATAAYDAILLDVDNGPDGLTRAANDGLYSPRGLADARAALRPGGVLAVWSAAPDAAFGRQLERSGFAVETV
uniref:spermidine synthase n=1 Tax=Sandarakinorhabdus oryzae TaxID=2675220 RepID=UPI0012E2D001